MVGVNHVRTSGLCKGFKRSARAFGQRTLCSALSTKLMTKKTSLHGVTKKPQVSVPMFKIPGELSCVV